jgi:hypothetical protein
VIRPAPKRLWRVAWFEARGFPIPFEWVERSRLFPEPAWRDQLLDEIAACPTHMLLVSVEETDCDWQPWTKAEPDDRHDDTARYEATASIEG